MLESEDAMTFDEWYATQKHQLSNEQVCRVIWEAATREEREACAKLCDGHSADASFLYGDYAAGCENEAAACAAAIRVRSNAKVSGAGTASAGLTG